MPMGETELVAPMDQYNRALLDCVHPANWVNPKPADRYNLVVIGAGTAGLVTAAGAAGLGAKVALVERHLMGGDCLNVGCVPSKSIIGSSRQAGAFREANSLGIRLPSNPEADFPDVMERMRRLRSGLSEHDSAHRFRELGVDVFFGEGHFIAPDCVEVAGARLPFRKACIATGARAIHPAIEGLLAAGFLTNETVFSLEERPRRLAVFGAGPLGCELAQAFQRLGSQVTILERGPQFLSREDPDAAAILFEAFRKDGVEVFLSTHVCRAEKSGGEKRLHVRTAGGSRVIAVDEILVGAGRAPNVTDLGLEAAGVEYNLHEGVRVDDFLCTTNRNVYAAGDVCLKHKFTHTADATARIVIQNALFSARRRFSTLTIPWCTYTDPEIAHVGIYERDAHEQGIEVDTFMREFADVDRAVLEGETAGFVKIHVRKGADAILGATIVARHAGDMISELTLAIVAGVGLRTIAGVIHPYPTQAEAIRQAADAYNRTRLTPRLARLFARWLAWRRS
jgi:pyruvate/2-oxoglutarate dehydrogenase complex dihydrolipoamide dehydrogenase (E3) component